MPRRYITLAPLLILLGLQMSGQEQRSFCAECPIAKPSTLPTYAWKTLEADQKVHELMGKEDGSMVNPHWFESSLMHAGPATERDYLVRGSGPMSGAHSTYFWLIHTNSSKAAILLVGFGDSIVFESSKHRGFCDVLVSYTRANTLESVFYVFDGKTYVERRVWGELKN